MKVRNAEMYMSDKDNIIQYELQTIYVDIFQI